MTVPWGPEAPPGSGRPLVTQAAMCRASRDLPEPGDGLLDDLGEHQARGDRVEFGVRLRLGVLIDDAVVFVEAGEDDAAGARAGVSEIEGFGDVCEVSGTQLSLVFLRLELAFLTHEFPYVCQGFRDGRI